MNALPSFPCKLSLKSDLCPRSCQQCCSKVSWEFYLTEWGAKFKSWSKQIDQICWFQWNIPLLTFDRSVLYQECFRPFFHRSFAGFYPLLSSEIADRVCLVAGQDGRCEGLCKSAVNQKIYCSLISSVILTGCFLVNKSKQILLANDALIVCNLRRSLTNRDSQNNVKIDWKHHRHHKIRNIESMR